MHEKRWVSWFFSEKLRVSHTIKLFVGAVSVYIKFSLSRNIKEQLEEKILPDYYPSLLWVFQQLGIVGEVGDEAIEVMWSDVFRLIS